MNLVGSSNINGMHTPSLHNHKGNDGSICSRALTFIVRRRVANADADADSALEVVVVGAERVVVVPHAVRARVAFERLDVASARKVEGAAAGGAGAARAAREEDVAVAFGEVRHAG